MSLWQKFINWLIMAPSGKPRDITVHQSFVQRMPKVEKPMINISELTDAEIVARTLDGEAGNQGYTGMQAVGCVIQNRVKLKWQGETTARGVCLHKFQFDCWLPGKDFERITSPNYAPLADSVVIANQVLKGNLPDITGGATHYFDNSIPPPSWAKAENFTGDIGKLHFYKLA